MCKIHYKAQLELIWGSLKEPNQADIFQRRSLFGIKWKISTLFVCHPIWMSCVSHFKFNLLELRDKTMKNSLCCTQVDQHLSIPTSSMVDLHLHSAHWFIFITPHLRLNLWVCAKNSHLCQWTRTQWKSCCVNSCSLLLRLHGWMSAGRRSRVSPLLHSPSSTCFCFSLKTFYRWKSSPREGANMCKHGAES